MKLIKDTRILQIEITNACWKRCANCTRLVGHHEKSFFMSLTEIENAIKSLDGFNGIIGIMGGEPTLHPNFIEICKLVQKYIPIHRAGIWTSGYKWDEYKKIISKTFGTILYNDHSDPNQHHQPILVGIDEIIQDENLKNKLINDCWIQKNWSPSININGGFFCEVAAAMSILFKEQNGYKIEKDWWKRSDYTEQIKTYCGLCSCAIPMPIPNSNKNKDTVSIKNLEKLLKIKSPKALKGDIEVFTRELSEQDIKLYKSKWQPWKYLGSIFKRKKNLKFNELFLIFPGFHTLRYYYLKAKHGFCNYLHI